MPTETEAVATYKKISICHKHFVQEINTVWESYQTIDYYSGFLHQCIKNDTISIPEFQSLTIGSNRLKTISKSNIFGTLSHIRDKKNPRTALIEAALIFEDYISSIVTLVYKDFPQRILKDSDSDDNQEKVIQIVLSSQDKEEIVDRLIEEKIRGLFYGNISDIFLKDKARVQLENTFNNPIGKELIRQMIEIFARRNIHIHNRGKVDRKYLRETKNTTLKLNSVLKIDQQYIRNSINVLTQVATVFTQAILKNIYKTSPVNKALKRTYWHK